MRERLVELLNRKYDHFCDQCGVNKDSHYTDSLADYLLENGVVLLPCKVGDVVYTIVSDFVKEHKIEKIEINPVGTYIFYDWHGGAYEMVNVVQIGKTVFLTREDAERALKGGAE